MKDSIRLQTADPAVWYDFAGMLKLARAVREYASEEKNAEKSRSAKKSC